MTDGGEQHGTTGGAPATLEELVDSVRWMRTFATRLERRIRVRTTVTVWFALAFTTLAVALFTITLGNTQRIQDAVGNDCVAYRDIAELPVPRSTNSPLRHLVEDFRYAYEGRCARYGPLDPLRFQTPSPTVTRSGG